MSIRTRLVFGLLMLLALMAGQASIAMYEVARLHNITEDLAGPAMARMEYISYVETQFMELRAAELGLTGAAPEEDVAHYREAIQGFWNDIETNVEEYLLRISHEPDRLGDSATFARQVGDYKEVSSRMVALQAVGRGDQAAQLFLQSQPTFDAVTAHVYRLRQDEFARSQKLSATAQALTSSSRYVFILLVVVVAAVELALGWFIWRSLSGGLQRLVAGTRRVSGGDLSQAVPVKGKDEFGELARAFNAMMGSLKASHEENRRLAEMTAKMQEERIRLLRDGLSGVVGAQEQERARVARELHDQAGQSLTALQFGLAQLERCADDPSLRQQAASLRDLAVETMDDIRSLALDLRPSALDELGLVPALRNYVRDFSRRFKIEAEFHATGLTQRLPPEIEIVLFRLVQEGLTNTAKHAKASKAAVTITARAAELEVRVEDNGVGFDIDEVLKGRGRKSLGLFGMRERIGLLGGTAEVQSAKGQGTRLVFTVPLPHYGTNGGTHEQDKAVVGR